MSLISKMAQLMFGGTRLLSLCLPAGLYTIPTREHDREWEASLVERNPQEYRLAKVNDSRSWKREGDKEFNIDEMDSKLLAICTVRQSY
jgi:hypothetical protein